MKDNISLIAAAAGGFILSVAISSLLSGTSVSSLHSKLQITSVTLNYSSQAVDEKKSDFKTDSK
ncbi:MAG: hypothetical protein AAF378_12840 [Cyanobacteria bacterium P01_A01_bin.84]